MFLMEVDQALNYIFCNKRLMLSDNVINLGGFAASFHPIIELYGRAIHIFVLLFINSGEYTFQTLPIKMVKMKVKELLTTSGPGSGPEESFSQWES